MATESVSLPYEGDGTAQATATACVLADMLSMNESRPVSVTIAPILLRHIDLFFINHPCTYVVVSRLLALITESKLPWMSHQLRRCLPLYVFMLFVPGKCCHIQICQLSCELSLSET